MDEKGTIVETGDADGIGREAENESEKDTDIGRGVGIGTDIDAGMMRDGIGVGVQIAEIADEEAGAENDPDTEETTENQDEMSEIREETRIVGNGEVDLLHSEIVEHEGIERAAKAYALSLATEFGVTHKELCTNQNLFTSVSSRFFLRCLDLLPHTWTCLLFGETLSRPVKQHVMTFT